MSAGLVRSAEGTLADAEPASLRCHVCEQHFGRPLTVIREIPCCETCRGIVEEAIASGAVIVRQRCAPWTTDGPPTCGAIWGEIRLARPMPGDGLVSDAHAVCTRCRPKQRAALDIVLDGFEEGGA